ncbi:MAG: hypothetical protein PVI19_11165 [Syntrophobacterales bacterium]|jgi:hypothetical protein
MTHKSFAFMVVLALLIILTMAVSTPAKEPGRYQAMEIDIGKKGEYTIFILDTRDGHMWILGTSKSRVDAKVSGDLKYQGKLRPGKKVGEVIFQFGIE